MSIGYRIMSLRQDGEKNEPFARRLGISHSTLLNTSRGAIPKIETFEIIAKNTGLVPAWLLFGTGPHTAKEAEAVEKFLEKYRQKEGGQND